MTTFADYAPSISHSEVASFKRYESDLLTSAPAPRRSVVSTVVAGETDTARAVVIAAPAETTTHSAQELTISAFSQLVKQSITGRAAPSRPALSTLLHELPRLVTDGGPVPQIGPAAGDGLEVQWLVDGVQVAMVVEGSGEWSLMAHDESGSVLIDEDYLVDESISAGTLAAAHILLARMGASSVIWPTS